MSETPDQRVQRLEAELAAAQADQRVERLQAQVADARASAADPTAPPMPYLAAPQETYAPTVPVTERAAFAGPVSYPPATPFFGHGPADYRELSEQNPADAFSSTASPRHGRGQVNGEIGQPAVQPNPLATPPRHVPLAFLAAAFSWRWWEVWAFFMIAVAPIALWMAIPWTGTVAFIATLVVAFVLRLRSDLGNYRLLRNGVVADDVRVRHDSTGTYYSGVTYQNVRMAVAHGWQVDRKWYSGPGTKSVLDFTVEGTPGTITLHGLPYEDGVIIADPRHPDAAKCVSEFPYDLDRDASGNWVGEVAARVWVGSFFTVALWGGWALLILYWQLAVVR